MITAYFDGGARNNPGPAGYGVHIVDDQGLVLAELHGSLGISTNNVARLTVKGDSLLIIEQMRGNYKVKNEGLKPLYLQARMLVSKIGKVTFEHVRRELNQHADRLSNLGMDGNQTSA